MTTANAPKDSDREDDEAHLRSRAALAIYAAACAMVAAGLLIDGCS